MQVKERLEIDVLDDDGDVACTICEDTVTVFEACFYDLDEAVQFFEKCCDEIRKRQGWQKKGPNGSYKFSVSEG